MLDPIGVVVVLLAIGGGGIIVIDALIIRKIRRMRDSNKDG